MNGFLAGFKSGFTAGMAVVFLVATAINESVRYRSAAAIIAFGFAFAAAYYWESGHRRGF